MKGYIYIVICCNKSPVHCTSVPKVNAILGFGARTMADGAGASPGNWGVVPCLAQEWGRVYPTHAEDRDPPYLFGEGYLHREKNRVIYLA